MTVPVPVPVHPLQSPWGRFHLYTFLIDAPELAIVDTGIASSPAEGMKPALEALGRRIEDVSGSCSPMATSTTSAAPTPCGR